MTKIEALLIIMSVVALAVVFYLIYVAYDAKGEVESRPSADMFVCDKHGVFPMKYALEFEKMAPDLAGLSGVSGVKYCPSCFAERVKEAKAHAGKS